MRALLSTALIVLVCMVLGASALSAVGGSSSARRTARNGRLGNFTMPQLYPTSVAGLEASAEEVVAGSKTRTYSLDIPARRMWGWGPGLHGYCGETSFQMSGLFFGQYVSSERVRYADGNRELLISVNDVKAAQTLSLRYDEWDYEQHAPPQSGDFLKWAKRHIDNGHVPIAGFYERQPKGDNDYDHIMPIVGYTEDVDKDTILGVYHHDLYLNDTTYTYGSELHASRKDCRQKEAPVQPYDYCIPNKYDYGIALKGIVDKKDETFRTRLTLPEWYEPDWGAEDGLHQTPVEFTFTAHITGLHPGTKYSILRFDDPTTVPESDFLQGGWARKTSFTPTSASHTIVLESVRSDGTYFYRTVETP